MRSEICAEAEVATSGRSSSLLIARDTRVGFGGQSGRFYNLWQRVHTGDATSTRWFKIMVPKLFLTCGQLLTSNPQS